jgi:hypothetical protein
MPSSVVRTFVPTFVLSIASLYILSSLRPTSLRALTQIKCVDTVCAPTPSLLPVSTMADVQQSESHSEIASLSPLAQLQFVSTTVLQQALDLVENILTSDEQLTIQSKFLPGSTIGIPALYDPYLLLRPHQENICGTHEITSFSLSIACQDPLHISFPMTPAVAIHPWKPISRKLGRPSDKLSYVSKK